MRIADIDSKRNVVNIRHAKGDKDRQVPLSLKILELLREYFKQYRPVTWLFEGEKPNTPYAAESLHKVFTAAKRKAGITIDGKITYQDYLDEYNNSKNYKPEQMSSNRSNRHTH